MTDFRDWGKASSDQSGASFKTADAKAVLAACRDFREFSPIELREVSIGASTYDVIIADVVLDGVPTRSKFGIQTTERLALAFDQAGEQPPQVRGLRTSFPSIPHLNHVPKGEPASLCLYFESWDEERRRFTPQRHLQRIIWWLTKSSRGEIHQPDQPLERIYFNPTDVYLLPQAFFQSREDPNLGLVVFRTVDLTPSGHIYFTNLRDRTDKNDPSLVLLYVRLPTLTHGSVEKYPHDLDELVSQLTRRGADLVDPLREAILRIPGISSGVPANPKERCIIILGMPLARTTGADPEDEQLAGYATDPGLGLAKLGEHLSILHHIGKGNYAPATIIGGRPAAPVRLDKVGLTPVSVQIAPHVESARSSSGLQPEASSFKGVLGGLGALGSALFNMWVRCGWGSWTLADPDIVLPHNIHRHTAFYGDVGSSKAEAASRHASITYGYQYYESEPISASLVDPTNKDIVKARQDADLVVDATTTLHVPRELGADDSSPRCASLFLTPNARSSVLLLEDKARQQRIDAIEAQYFGHVLAAPWGETHLLGPGGQVVVGPSCRNVSAVLAYDSVLLQASQLSILLRTAAQATDPAAYICSEHTPVPELLLLHPSERKSLGDWTVVSHEGIANKLASLRAARLPVETGGILVGYIDQATRHIYIVDAHSAPSDSKESRTGFVRGVEGVAECLEIVHNRTGGVVGYIGEWHSHPKGHSSNMSATDLGLLTQLALELHRDGNPILMAIAGENDIGFSLMQVET